jgi:hypothetical protein
MRQPRLFHRLPVRRVEKTWTSIVPRVQTHFVECMTILRETAAYTELRKVVTLPAARETAATGGALPAEDCEPWVALITRY